MKIKFCGNHSLQDVKLACESDAHYIGFVFAKSKRQVKPENVQKWLSQVNRKSEQQIVGVFVNNTIEFIEHAVRIASLDIVQLHGTETLAFAELVKKTCNTDVWKVIHHDESAHERMDQFRNVVDAYLIDNKSKRGWGGTGKAFDWSFVPRYVEKAHSFQKPCFIAGGVNVMNVRDLMKHQPDGIDLASGIETNLRKDKQKMIELQERVKSNDDNVTK